MNFVYSQTKPERTQWRDQRLSERHRKWGFNCPAIDIDFLMIEFHEGFPVAIIDYKRYTGSINNLHQKSIKAISTLANNSKIPFFVVFYWDDVWAFQIKAMNNIAKNILHQHKIEENKILTEQQYVYFLYKLRNIKLSKEEEELIKSLNNELPNLRNKED
jgi:hypothetical protein